MIIHKPKIRREGEYIYLSSDIEVESDNSLSTNIWYRFPVDQESFVSDRSDAFVVGLIFLAMKLNEDITVEGVMSPKLAYNLKQFQGYFHTWYPEEFHVVNINCKNLIDDAGEKNAIVSSFSGGIDSFYTLAYHIREAKKIDKMTHCLYVRGFDMPLDDESNEYVKKRYEKLLGELGIKLLKADTNLKGFLDKQVPEAKTFGAVLVSVFLTLSKGISRVYLASAYQYHDLLPLPKSAAVADGSNPVTDNFFSLEKTFIYHYDSSVSRIKKTIEISKWPATYSNLRVCWYAEGMKNCCKCSKCMRTMLTLQLCGKLDSYKDCFYMPLDKKTMEKWVFDVRKDTGFANELIDYASSVGRKDVALQMRYLLFKSKYSPLSAFYRLSYKLKQSSPAYTKFVYSLKESINLK